MFSPVATVGAQAYTGDRLRNTLDWSLSSVGEDVTAHTEKLTEMERRLFSSGARASAQHCRWKVHGFSRLGRGAQRIPPVPRAAPHLAQSLGSSDAASPGRDSHRSKRARTG
jgi:hypothetical protein